MTDQAATATAPQADTGTGADTVSQVQAAPAAPATLADLARSPSDYGITGDNLSEAFAEQAFSLGFSKSQAQGLRGWWEGLNEHARQATEQAKAEAAAQLMREWGQSYSANMGLAGKVLGQLGTPALAEKLDSTGLGNDPDLVRVFHRIGQLLSEDSLIMGASGGGSAPLSAAEIFYPNSK